MNKLIVLAMMLLTLDVIAAEFPVSDGDTVTVKLSRNDLTRIAMKGDMRISKFWGGGDTLEIQPDKDSGEIFIRPLPGIGSRAISFFIRDDAGSTYTIIAQQYDIPSETIILAAKRKNVSALELPGKSLPYVKKVKSLFKAMATDDPLEGYVIDSLSKNVDLWNETSIKLIKSWTGSELVGEVYRIENVSDGEIEFHENEFSNFGDRVRAVGLDSLALGVGEITYLYVIRSPGGGV